MTKEVRDYIQEATNVLTLSAAAIEGVRSGQNSPQLARQVVQHLRAESRRARGIAALFGQHTDARVALEALARDASRLKGEARKLCR